MILKLLIVSIFLFSCANGHFISKTEYFKIVTGLDFREHVEKRYTYFGGKGVPRKNKPNLFKEFKYIEEVNKTLPNGNKIYRYSHPYNDCKSTFIVNQKNIVIKAFGDGEDCDVAL
ncbi:hypothetical protein [uncultured Gammaproteobacteria bacterium]|jgi:hypothetical protein|uniref:hypothetical protein n=1 Tax=thiotrophic endosymbiont of Bathymodiolus puteoserpentis (Logatchev) TaxID=343240 RepID=UPI0010B0E7B5|nr:hypothetical protein [thiotrophic endosymbiont of Bathymodiolus puteoserpentis (Logatchev)]CAC9567658.1 hypothetical protein [uncultured Gammaproteobacteria bacterium]CAC9586064.1 hypothetical protein [uncultured Gammaproteobacteria bacterium]CAC9628682.1 hypothetical protein [uncultured Gammaproteobacteria bacterium]CAC9651087.1 hypothetical protein [uncultured Gammaproteobacteria bacterium]CAC9659401.1 hypothetical protein [uncultured Gammaproteobacteria bacterium]